MPTSISVIGNVGNDPETRKTNGGTEIVEIRVASQDGKDKTSWWTCKFFGNKAGETVARYVKKGSSVMVVGTAEEETWERDGKKNSKIVVNASSFAFIGGGKSDSKKPVEKSTHQEQQEDDLNSDVPF